MTDDAPILCSDADIADLIALAGKDSVAGQAALAQRLAGFPADPRLHFLSGSLRAGAGDYDGARIAMRRAIEIAPDYPLARFQLGMLLMTSGEFPAALEVLHPLIKPAPANYLEWFAAGAAHFMRDEFEAAIPALRQGLALNLENAALNHDMALLLSRLETPENRTDDPEGAEPSAAQLLLQQAALRSTRH